MDRLTDLELLIGIDDHGSLGRAAQNLGLSSAAATRHLAALEARLGVRLVERNTRWAYLTGEGREFCHRARAILTDLQEAESAVQANALRPSGLLRVSASLPFAMQQIAPRLPRYLERYPEVRIHVETANRYLDMIDQGIDVAVRTREYEPDSTITIRKLATTRRLLTAAPEYLARRGTPARPQDLARHKMLVYVHANHPWELRFNRGDEQAVVRIDGLLESNDGQVLRAAALGGLGILVQPAYIVQDDVDAGRLVRVLDDWDLPRLQINLAYPSRKMLSAKVRTFLDFMVEEFRADSCEARWTTMQAASAALPKKKLA